MSTSIEEGYTSRANSVSRLRVAKNALVAQLHALLRDHPARRVALVTFDTEIAIYLGDGSPPFTCTLLLSEFYKI